MKKVKFDQKIAGKPQAVFSILYALDGKPWANYPGSNGRANLIIPTCIMINRSDGWIGFVGGKVDQNETLEEAAKREVREEIGYEVTSPLENIVAHDIGPFTTHVFAVQLTYEDLREIQKNSPQASHFGSEITGVFLPHLINQNQLYSTRGSIAGIIKSSLAPSVREELIHFLVNKKILPQKELSEICDSCGYSLETLLR